MFFTEVLKFSKLINGRRSMALQISVLNKCAEATAIKCLKSGSVIAVPTDTVYGLACDATNSSAINKLYSIKCRNANKPLAICIGEVCDVENWARVDHLPQNLLQALLPGAVTLILPTTLNTLDKSLIFKGKIGIRIPNYIFIQNLVSGLGKPLALTSANVSNDPSAVTVMEFSSIWDKISVILDGGHLGNNHCASTVIDLSKLGVYNILRKGVACEETEIVLRKFGLKSS